MNGPQIVQPDQALFQWPVDGFEPVIPPALASIGQDWLIGAVLILYVLCLAYGMTWRLRR